MLEKKYEHLKMYDVNVSELKLNPKQPRGKIKDEDVKELSNSISSKGVLQPIIFTELDGDKVVLAGERRVKASILANKDTIPARYYKIADDDSPDKVQVEVAVIENLHRKDLTPIEEAEAMHKMKDHLNYIDEDISKVTGYSRSRVTEILAINKLDDRIKVACKNGANINKTNLIHLAKIKDAELAFKTFNSICENILTEDKVNQLNGELQVAIKTISTPNKVLRSIKTLSKHLLDLDTTIEADDKVRIGEELTKLEDEIKRLKELHGI